MNEVDYIFQYSFVDKTMIYASIVFLIEFYDEMGGVGKGREEEEKLALKAVSQFIKLVYFLPLTNILVYMLQFRSTILFKSFRQLQLY